MVKSKSGMELRVGLFVATALLVGDLAFVIGNQSNLLDEDDRAVFDEVDVGYAPATRVRVAGVVVGTVQSVSFLDDGRLEARFRTSTRRRSSCAATPRPFRQRTRPRRRRRRAASASGARACWATSSSTSPWACSTLPAWPPETPMLLDGSTGLKSGPDVAEEVEATARNLRLLTDPLRDQVRSPRTSKPSRTT